MTMMRRVETRKKRTDRLDKFLDRASTSYFALFITAYYSRSMNFTAFTHLPE
jgi:hypothetical protein